MTSNKKETIGIRPSEYSDWHRQNLPEDHYMCDIDCVEWRIRDGIQTIVAGYGVTGGLIDRQHIQNSLDSIIKRTKNERLLLYQFGKRFNCKSFFLIHTIGMKLCYVIPLHPSSMLDGMPTWFGEDDFKSFLEEL